MSDLPSGFPDLLFPNGELRLDRKPLMQGLAFAFASGDGGELIESALERARVGESTFVPAGFARELFLGEVAKICFPLGGIEPRLQARMSYLERILSEPPKDPEVTAFRRAITDEIRSSPLVFDQAREALIRLDRTAVALEQAA